MQGAQFLLYESPALSLPDKRIHPLVVPMCRDRGQIDNPRNLSGQAGLVGER